MQLSAALVHAGWMNIFDGEEIGVAFRNNGSGENLAITFDYLSGSGHGRQKLTAQRLFEDIRYDHMHFPATRPAWYQSQETLAALDAAARVSSRYKQVVLYGGSQGGYAALLFSGPLNGTKVVAFAPQFSVDPTKAPFEGRFNAYVKDIEFVFDDMAGSISPSARKYLVYDPYHAPDRMHADLLKDLPNTVEVRLPFAGHYPATFFSEMGVLYPAVSHLFLDEDPLPAVMRLRRASRGRSVRYMLELAHALGQRGRFFEAIRAINAAYVIDPNSISVVESYFAALQSDGVWTGLALMLVRLIQKEHPEWTHYEGARERLHDQLVRLDATRTGQPTVAPEPHHEP